MARCRSKLLACRVFQARRRRKSDTRSSMSDADVLPIFRDSKARRDGYLAGRRGGTGADNPFKGETREACAWLMGMLEGRAKRLKVVAIGKTPAIATAPQIAATAPGSPQPSHRLDLAPVVVPKQRGTRPDGWNKGHRQPLCMRPADTPHPWLATSIRQPPSRRLPFFAFTVAKFRQKMSRHAENVRPKSRVRRIMKKSSRARR